MKYKIELHCHTAPVSGCSILSGEDIIRLYKEAGYDAITVTDHFTSDYFRHHDFEEYFQGYELAKKVGEEVGIKVYLGAEFRFDGSANDYLLFGVTKEFLKEATKMFTADHYTFHDFTKKNGVLFYQAHPFRPGLTRAPADALDGMEIYNMHPHHHSNNPTAIEYAKEKGLHGISGSDAHEPHMVGRGGILAETLPNDGIELRDLILSRNYELIHNGECV